MSERKSKLTEGDTPKEAFLISRVFDAPRELMFQVWTDPKHMAKWFGPQGCNVRYEKADVHPGGTAHYCMVLPDGKEMWGKAVYKEIEAPRLLVYVQSFSDKNQGLTRHPMSPTWPMEMLTTIYFIDLGEKTRLTLSWLPVNASNEERATFEAGKPGMNQGWGGTFDGLAGYLAELKK